MQSQLGSMSSKEGLQTTQTIGQSPKKRMFQEESRSDARGSVAAGGEKSGRERQLGSLGRRSLSLDSVIW
jgi:hypothetical protein